MRQPLQLVIGLLACLALASAVPGLFPRNKSTLYKYYADVKTGTIEPTPFASQFGITGFMHITPERRIPNLENAFHVHFNVTHGIRNGAIQHHERIEENTLPLPDAAKILNDPFIMIFDDNGKVKGLMVYEHEAGWSRNMKQSIASMFQLDLSSMHLEAPIPWHSFLTKEDTIYGECAVAYDVHHTLGFDERHFTVTKSMEPMSCTKYQPHIFNYKESSGCLVKSEEEMAVGCGRIFNIENTGEDLLIKTMIAYGIINYTPWNARSEAHYVLANQSIELHSTVPIDSITLPELNTTEMVTLDDVAFKKSESLYAPHAGVDPTYGRHVINLEHLIASLMRMLGEAIDYMSENNLEMTSPEMENGQTMSQILITMSRMDLPSLEHVFNNIIEGTTPRDVTIKSLFLHMVPYVGTNATCLFTRNIIRKHKIDDVTAISMLTRLPYNIREPTDSLLIEMEGIMQFGNETSLGVRVAGILAFGTMIYKTHEHESYHTIMSSELVGRYVHYYHQQMMNEQTYGMKMAYLHALRNLELHDAYKLLEPIIRGELNLTDKPDYFRFHAMLINWRRTRNAEYVHNLYWPILSNTTEPLILRLAAYTILLQQEPQMVSLMRLHLLMMFEKDKHLYNYHYTFLISLANSKDPCISPLKEKAQNLLRFTKVRKDSGTLTSAWRVDYINKYGFGDAFGLLLAFDEHTGAPYAGTIEYVSLNNRRPVHQLGMWLRVEGLSNLDMFWRNMTSEKSDIQMEEIENVLKKASQDMPSQKPIHIEFAILVQGRTVMSHHFDSIPDVSQIMEISQTSEGLKFNSLSVDFDELFDTLVPNDLGLPTFLINNVPRVQSIQASNEVTSQTPPLFAMKFKTFIKDSRNGYYAIEAYNPILDTRHSIRRVSAWDVVLPIEMSVAYNLESKSIKFNLPRLPITRYSTSGFRSYAANYVTVTEAQDGVLEQYCGANCRSTEVVTLGPEHRKNTTLVNLDSKDLGLRFGMYQYNCERANVPKSRWEMLTEMLSVENKNTWDNNAVLGALTLREIYLNLLNSPEPRTCGYLATLGPSEIYPTSEVDINVRMSLEVPASKIMTLLPATRINIRGTLDAKAAGTNVSAQSWTMLANVGTSQGFINSQAQLQLTRMTPGATDLKICIDAYKIYPTLEVDPLTRNPTTKQEIMGKLTLTMGESENGTCVRDKMSIMINQKVEMSSEQKEALAREIADGQCNKDVENPVYLYTESSIVPRTLGCLREALLRTTMRRYNYTIIYKNIPESIMPTIYRLADDWRSDMSGDVTYLPAHTEPGILKVSVEFPLYADVMNLNIRTPTHELRYANVTDSTIPGYALGRRGMNYVVRNEIATDVDFVDYQSNIVNLESTQFTRNFVQRLHNRQIKFCTIYPEVLLNADGTVFPYTVPGQWTMLTGDHIGYRFSVFVKRLEPKKLGLLMSVRNHTILVIPSATIPTVTVDDNVIDHVSGMTITGVGTSYTLKIFWHHNRLIVQSSDTSFDLEWTERSVTLAMDVSLQGKVAGLCGHLDGTHEHHMAKEYTFGQ